MCLLVSPLVGGAQTSCPGCNRVCVCVCVAGLRLGPRLPPPPSIQEVRLELSGEIWIFHYCALIFVFHFIVFLYNFFILLEREKMMMV